MSESLFHRAVVSVLPTVPRPIIWRFSRRYIAGTSLEDAVRVIKALNQQQIVATVDVLGEDSTRDEQVTRARDLYLSALHEISTQGLECNISVKLSEMGVRFAPDRCYDLMGELLETARGYNNFVRIDMEDSTLTTQTLELYRALRKNHQNVGAVIQSYLRRSEQDVNQLLADGPTNIRLCKGIYVEPADIAYKDEDEIRQSFCRLLEILFLGGATRIGIATHDPQLIDFALALLEREQIQKERYEFQMLLGVAGKLRKQLVAAGHPLRVYVPFGEAWHAYSMRRLRENPKIIGHILSNLFTPH